MAGLPGSAPGAHRGRRLIAALAVIAAVVLALAVGWRLTLPGRELRAAEQALAGNDPAAARVHLERCLAFQSDDDRALFLAAQAARRCDACADAERFLAACEEVRKSDETRMEWALLGAQQGDFGRDEQRLLDEAALDNSQALVVLEALAKGYYAAYRFTDAIATAGRLLERSPDHVPALVLRGTVLDHIRKTDLAAEDFRRAVELAPENFAAQLALAGLLNRRGKSREAIFHYECALRLRPGDAAALLGLARAQADSADLAGAHVQLEALLAAQPEHVTGLIERARLALRRNQAAEAESFLTRALRAAPWRRDAQRLLCVALKELGRTEELTRAEARLNDMIAEDGIGGRLKLRARDNPGDTEVRWELWQWSLRNGETEEGFAWLTEIVRAAPRHAQAHTALASYFERAGQPRRGSQHRMTNALSDLERQGRNRP